MLVACCACLQRNASSVRVEQQPAGPASFGAAAVLNGVCSLLPAALQGYGFCEFADGTVVDGVIKSLHNSVVDGRKITVKRADDDSAPASISGSST